MLSGQSSGWKLLRVLKEKLSISEISGNYFTLCYMTVLEKDTELSFLLGNRTHPCSYPDSTDKHLLISKGPMQGQPQRCLFRAGPCHNSVVQSFVRH